MDETIAVRERREEDDFPESPRLRWLRRSVTLLMATMAVGVLGVAAALIWRLGPGATPSAPPPLPPPQASILTLPEGAQVTAIGGDAGSVIVGMRARDGSEWLVYYDRETGAETRRVAVSRAAR